MEGVVQLYCLNFADFFSFEIIFVFYERTAHAKSIYSQTKHLIRNFKVFQSIAHRTLDTHSKTQIPSKFHWIVFDSWCVCAVKLQIPSGNKFCIFGKFSLPQHTKLFVKLPISIHQFLLLHTHEPHTHTRTTYFLHEECLFNRMHCVLVYHMYIHKEALIHICIYISQFE